MTSLDEPLTGGCMCGAVRFQVDAPFIDAGICHCRRCQIRSGQGASFSAIAAAKSVTVTDGRGQLRVWRPDHGNPKWFCDECGAHVLGGDLGGAGQVVVRLGALDEPPPIEPRWHAWTLSASALAPVPDDGLPRYETKRPG
jgi:hypothetical protein